VRAVEAELTRLREEASRAGEARGGPGVLRACTLNLVVCAGAGEAPAGLTPLLAEVMAEHPCRALVLVEDAAAGEAVRATIGALCRRPAAGDGLVCGEQVLLAAGEAGRRAAASAALSLLVPGLPVVLWWRDGSPDADARFALLADVADRVLLDCARLGEGGAGLRVLAGLVERTRPAAVGDLEWAALTPWRSLTAQFFDPPEARPHLHRLAEVVVTFGPTPAGLAQALLYAGWLGSRLGWGGTEPARRAAGGEIVAAREREGGAVRLRLTPAAAGGVAGLRGVSLQGEENAPARFRLDRAAEGVCVAAEAALGPRGPLCRTVSVEVPEEAFLVRRELGFPGRDAVFEEALRAAAALAPR
jgi:glucose-6-phosphate dehydrogenase assembly protein OpcA